MIIEDVIQDVISDPIQDIIVAGYPAILDTVLTWRDNTTIVTSGLNVVGSTNKGVGGAGFDLISAGGSLGTLTVGSINGLNTIFHNGASNMRLRTNAEVITLSPYTGYFVFKSDAAMPALTIFYDSFGSAITNNRFAIQDNGSGLYRVGYISKGGIASVGATNTIVNTIISTNDGNGAGAAQLGGAAPVNFTTSAGDGYSHSTVFADRAGTNDVTTPFHLCEKILDDRLHTQIEQDEIHNYLIAKWGAN